MEGFPRESSKHPNMNFSVLQVFPKEMKVRMELLRVLSWQWGRHERWGNRELQPNILSKKHCPTNSFISSDST